MKVYRLGRRGSIHSLGLHEEPVPRPQRGEVLVRVRAVSLNYRDLAMVYGHYFPDAPDGLIPVSDAAGEVADVGEGVTGFAIGDRVINVFNPRWFGGPYPGTAAYEYGTAQDGWLTQYKTVSEESLVAMPHGMSFEQAATLPCAAVTAWTALTGPLPVTAGDTVLTQGTGGVSLFALQLAKLIGARVIATTSSPAKAERLTALGADEVIDYTSNPQWGRLARELTGGRGVDRIIEVGGAATFAQTLIAGSDRAEIDAIGFLGPKDWGVEFMDLFNGGFETIRRIRVGSRQDTQSLLRFLARHNLEPVIDGVYPFEQTLDAWHRLDTRANFGKVVITL
ncbi:zinc-dependent alcohol dehydrogenase family protein [Actinoallomurus soli]|uniref:zinc-dependent alcohol dehydrogenase family protein n=1 Tax=Actinoallomurus soli TaxID=2952535 RepID=UPI002093ED63|nr:NAD(P)-dependent alcohol dehydrogenase [Actinoallomurus soli]MCO5972991.1 NAD(P)-dependent alcohol dehydrogenase [Actinoallomurus soli]